MLTNLGLACPFPGQYVRKEFLATIGRHSLLSIPRGLVDRLTLKGSTVLP